MNVDCNFGMWTLEKHCTFQPRKCLEDASSYHGFKHCNSLPSDSKHFVKSSQSKLTDMSPCALEKIPYSESWSGLQLYTIVCGTINISSINLHFYLVTMETCCN